MFRHIRIRELFRACWVTCESNAMVDKILRYTLLCVCYVEVWYASIYLVSCLLCGGLVYTDLSGYMSFMWRPGIYRSVWLRVCYVEAWYIPICLVTLPSAFRRNHHNPAHRSRNHTLYYIPPHRFVFQVTEEDLISSLMSEPVRRMKDWYNQCILLVSSNASDNARYEHWNTPIPNFRKIGPVGTKLIHVHIRTNRSESIRRF
jgi:hypothetical protein